MSETNPAEDGPPPVGGAEYRFRIDAYTPATIPMARLGEYMTQLAAALGEEASVHFVRLEAGSTTLVQRIEREAIPKVHSRTEAIRRGDAPRAALRAYRMINRFLREDDGAARLTAPSGVVLDFPGRGEVTDADAFVKQEGTVDGRLVRVGGTDRKVPVLLQADGEQIVGCFADRSVAKKLAERLFEHVRLYGTGRWRRDGTGQWTLDTFHIRTFEPLQNASLSSVLGELREIAGEFGPGAYTELDEIRYGPTARTDGRP